MKNSLFKIIVLVLVILSSNKMHAQVADTIKLDEKINILKINVPALFFGNLSLQYERGISKKHSFGLNIRYRPKLTMPFQDIVDKLIDQSTIRLDLFKMGNFGITPEYRVYFGKKLVPQGFYIGPFISFNHYNADIPVNYMNDTKTGVFKGGLTTFTAGFQLGAQWKLSRKVYLDWWIIGPNYGISKGGDFAFATPLNETEQISMDFELFRIKEGTNPKIINSYKVTADGASFEVDGTPWAGIRAMGINIGYRF